MDEKNYEKWLDRGYSKLPETASKKGRLEVPELQHLQMGKRTFIKNFKQICNALSRSEQHLLKFLAKELATAGSIDGEQAIFQGKFNRELIELIMDDYLKEFVVCPVCRSPDTKVVREERFRFLLCEACGARSSVRPG
jgi:translation initiation factor 2 subunit 2